MKTGTTNNQIYGILNLLEKVDEQLHELLRTEQSKCKIWLVNSKPEKQGELAKFVAVVSAKTEEDAIKCFCYTMEYTGECFVQFVAEESAFDTQIIHATKR